MNRRLAIVVSHPTQYYSPWFRHIAEANQIDLKVFYLWDFGVGKSLDRKFERQFQWDVPLLDGYQSTFVKNRASDPGTHHFRGLDNPSLLSEISEYDPHAILVFGYAWKSVFSLIWRRPRRMPILLRGDSHGLAPSNTTVRRRLRARVARATLSKCQGMLAVGSANKAYYKDSGVSSHRIFHVPHCVDNARFQDPTHLAMAPVMRSKIGTDLDTTVFLFAGKFEQKKRPDLLVKAFREVTSNTAELWMIGSGPLETQLRQCAGGDPRIRFLGFRNQAELPVIFSAGTSIVLPSEGPGETWGLVINEAMNCGCAPIVSNHVGCHPDLVRNTENGWVFSAGSHDSLAACLNEAAENPQRLNQFGIRSRQLIDSYSYDAATSGLMQAIQAVTS